LPLNSKELKSRVIYKTKPHDIRTVSVEQVRVTAIRHISGQWLRVSSDIGWVVVCPACGL